MTKTQPFSIVLRHEITPWGEWVDPRRFCSNLKECRLINHNPQVTTTTHDSCHLFCVASHTEAQSPPYPHRPSSPPLAHPPRSPPAERTPKGLGTARHLKAACTTEKQNKQVAKTTKGFHHTVSLSRSLSMSISNIYFISLLAFALSFYVSRDLSIYLSVFTVSIYLLIVCEVILSLWSLSR